MLVVVAGHSRRVGKSSLIASLIRHFAEREWTALKISPHRHRAPGDTFLLTAEAATHRFREAGAREAFLLRAPDDQVAAAVESVRWLADPARHVVAESNRLVSLRRPDLLLFACDPANPDWKESSAICVPRADAV
ncbi:MAG: hypothetical protein K2Q23_06495, partial [Bryobacteraceae bacterium]|nr:hypothetical protein [Bryobacteraceae bacterium]